MFSFALIAALAPAPAPGRQGLDRANSCRLLPRAPSGAVILHGAPAQPGEGDALLRIGTDLAVRAPIGTAAGSPCRAQRKNSLDSSPSQMGGTTRAPLSSACARCEAASRRPRSLGRGDRCKVTRPTVGIGRTKKLRRPRAHDLERRLERSG